jgi:hypothetical protein
MNQLMFASRLLCYPQTNCGMLNLDLENLDFAQSVSRLARQHGVWRLDEWSTSEPSLFG